MQESHRRGRAQRASPRDLHHGPGPAGLFPVHPRRRLGRLPHDRARAVERGRGRRAHPAGVRARRPVAHAGHRLRRPHDRLHPDDGRARSRSRARRRQPAKPWALDGSSGGTGASKVIWTWRLGKHNTPGLGPDQHWRTSRRSTTRSRAVEARHVARHVDDAGTSSCRSARRARSSTTSSTSCAPKVTRSARSARSRCGRSRARRSPQAAAGCEQVLVYELNAGQMIDDVRLAVNGAVPVHAIGGVSQDESGMRQGDLLGVDTMRDRILAAIEGVDRGAREADARRRLGRPQGRAASRPTCCRAPTTTSARAAAIRSRGGCWSRCSTSSVWSTARSAWWATAATPRSSPPPTSSSCSACTVARRRWPPG